MVHSPVSACKLAGEERSNRIIGQLILDRNPEMHELPVMTRASDTFVENTPRCESQASVIISQFDSNVLSWSV